MTTEKKGVVDDACMDLTSISQGFSSPFRTKVTLFTHNRHMPVVKRKKKENQPRAY
jgi:hypothetical protein